MRINTDGAQETIGWPETWALESEADEPVKTLVPMEGAPAWPVPGVVGPEGTGRMGGGAN